MMTIDPTHQQVTLQFLEFYYELAIFELTATYGKGAFITFEHVAAVFDIAAETSEKFPDLLYPCASAIRAYGLDGIHVRKFLQTLEPTLLSTLSFTPTGPYVAPPPPPSPTATSTTTTATATTSVANIKAASDCCGYKITETGVCLPTWSAADERMFLVQYAELVPYHYKDDLAVFIYELLNSWSIRGSGGEVKMVREGLQGLIKFTDMNMAKRVIFNQHDEERRLRVERQTKEKEKRLEQERQKKEEEERLEQERQKKEEEERLEQERQRKKEEEERLEQERQRKEEEHLEQERQKKEEERLNQERLKKEEEQERLREAERVQKEKEEINRVQKEKELDHIRVEQELDCIRKEKELRAKEVQEKVLAREQMIEDKMQELLSTTRATDARKQQVQELKERLTAELRSQFQKDDIEVLLFGSFATGLCHQSSDADFSVIDRSRSISSITALAKALRGLGYTNVEAIPGARVPIATFEDPVNRIQCDISLNQRHGVYNSKLIDTYRRIDPRFMPLWFAIRHLAKKGYIISGRQRLLTSYALVMMMIVFLQAQAKSVLPNLQEPGKTKPGPSIDGSKYSFDDNWAKLANAGSTNDSSSAALLKEFCRFFGNKFEYKTHEINPRLAKIKKTRDVTVAKPCDRNKLKEAPICIMDPFIIDRNLAGNIPEYHVRKIKMIFRDASLALANGDINRLFS
ncbi:hypothetical protein EMPS_10066 [Entomortierella parvispora]|uniref:polynucleotide adenylyltransferase n=1 Tax=Entomortierella parvispora TaxID=205924 RepID=A0A9P3M0Z0_9FUNG|nr:hypothetical protein EMPS_10066 [Entomortierella parvispora]